MSAPDPDALGDRLRHAADAATPRPIDVDAVLRASRARRRSGRNAIVGGAGVAVVVLAVGGLVLGLQPLGRGSITADAPASQETLESADLLPQETAGGEASDTRLAPPEKVNACGLELAAPTEASPSGLVVTVEPVGPVTSGAEGDVRVLVTNAGGSIVTGEVRAVPAMAVAAGGVTTWHTNGVVTADLQPIELAPGESTELRGAVRAVACTEADEAAESFPDDLPPLAPGAYGVSAVVMYVDHASGVIEYLIAPAAPLTVQ